MSTTLTRIETKNGRLSLRGKTAAELMTPNPLSIHEHATLHDAASFFSQKRISAAPVINVAGRPVGVVGRTDLIRYLSAAAMQSQSVREAHAQDDLAESDAATIDTVATRQIQVREIMTPVIFAVPCDTPLLAVIDEMIVRCVHRVFVLGEDDVLIGVISTLDLLRAIREASV